MHAWTRLWTVSLLFAATATAQDVLVVTPVPGPGEYSNPADAFAAAGDGDVVLVEPGTYLNPFAAFVIDGKGLTVLGDGSPDPILGSVIVRDIPPGGTVTFRHLEFDPIGSLALGPGVLLEGDDGALWIEDCTVHGTDGAAGFGGFESTDGLPAVHVADGAHATIVRSTLAGGEGITTSSAPFGVTDASAGGPALRVDGGGRASVQSSVLAGGDGGSDIVLGGDGENGGDALEVGPGQVTLSGCAVVGGRGGDGCSGPSPDFCAGGDGLAQQGSSVAWIVDSTFAEGAGGTLDGGATGIPGVPRSSTPGDTTTDLDGTHHELEISSPMREDALGTITYRGETGDLIGLYLAVPSSYAMLVGKRNVFHLGSPLLGPVLIVNVLDPGGELVIPFVAWSLDPTGLDSVGVFAQCFLKNGTTPVRLSEPTQLTIVSDTF